VEKLSQFRITLLYENEKVWQQEVDLSYGIRLVYGDPLRLKAFLGTKLIDDVDMNVVAFPKYAGTSTRVTMILKAFDLGITLKTDGRNILCGTRFCQSHVYYFKDILHARISTKMERKQQVELFSYFKCIQRLLRRRLNIICTDYDCQTMLVIGTKSSTKVLVSVVIEPIISELLISYFGGKHSDNTSWPVDKQMGHDELVRMANDFDAI